MSTEWKSRGTSSRVFLSEFFSNGRKGKDEQKSRLNFMYSCYWDAPHREKWGVMRFEMGPACKNWRYFSRFSFKHEANVERETRATGGRKARQTQRVTFRRLMRGGQRLRRTSGAPRPLNYSWKNKCGRKGCGCPGEWGRDGYGRWE